MRAPTGNVITQTKHGATDAVDYSWQTPTKDATVYAPEDMSWDSYKQRGVGKLNAGNALRMIGANGLHQFAHLGRILIKAGQSVKKGDPIAVMGDTGYTQGRHLHWWILKNGKYIYPPTLVNEKFGGPVTPFDMPRINAPVQNSQNRTIYKRDSNVVLGTIKAPMSHYCRGYDAKYPNRMYGHSKQFGDFSMALYYTDGRKIEGVSW